MSFPAPGVLTHLDRSLGGSHLSEALTDCLVSLASYVCQPAPTKRATRAIDSGSEPPPESRPVPDARARRAFSNIAFEAQEAGVMAGCPLLAWSPRALGSQSPLQACQLQPANWASGTIPFGFSPCSLASMIYQQPRIYLPRYGGWGRLPGRSPT